MAVVGNEALKLSIFGFTFENHLLACSLGYDLTIIQYCALPIPYPPITSNRISPKTQTRKKNTTTIR